MSALTPSPPDLSALSPALVALCQAEIDGTADRVDLAPALEAAEHGGFTTLVGLLLSPRTEDAARVMLTRVVNRLAPSLVDQWLAWLDDGATELFTREAIRLTERHSLVLTAPQVARAIDRLGLLLRQGGRWERRMAARTLARFGAYRDLVRPHLQAVINDPEMATAQEACRALSRDQWLADLSSDECQSLVAAMYGRERMVMDTEPMLRLALRPESLQVPAFRASALQAAQVHAEIALALLPNLSEAELRTLITDWVDDSPARTLGGRRQFRSGLLHEARRRRSVFLAAATYGDAGMRSDLVLMLPEVDHGAMTPAPTSGPGPETVTEPLAPLPTSAPVPTSTSTPGPPQKAGTNRPGRR